MAKVPSDKLYRLIKSLSGSEKRYFKVFVGNAAQKEHLYIALFDLMDESAEFDDDLWKRKLYYDQPPDSKTYTVLKAYLYDLILKALQSYDEKNSIIYKLNHYLQSVAVLYKRGLYDDCANLLYKAEKIAEEYECYSYLLEVLNWRKQVAYTKADIDFLNKELEQIHRQESLLIARQNEELAARQDFFTVLLEVRRGAQSEKARPLLQEPSGSESSLADKEATVKATVLRMRAQNLRHYLKNELQEFYQTGESMIAFIEAHPHLLQESMTEYIAAISNFIVSCGLLNKYDKVEAALEKLRNLKPNTHDDQLKIHRQYYNNKFALCIFSGTFEEGMKLIEAHQQEIKTLGIERFESASLLFQYFTICFGIGDYDRATTYLNEWMNQPRSVDRLDLQSIARILNLILHYEEGNIHLLEYKLRGTTRYLRSRKQEYAMEKLFIRLISDLIKTTNAREVQSLVWKTKNELLGIAQQPTVRSILQTFDFEAWLESKVNHSSFAKTVQEKYRRTIQGN